MDAQSEFQQWVDSVEKSVNDAWVEIEVYVMRVPVGNRNRAYWMYVERGIVVKEYMVDEFWNSHLGEFSGLQSRMGQNTWGMKLRQHGYKKSSSMWRNTMTNEVIHHSPTENWMLTA